MTAEGLSTQYRRQLANELTPPITRQTSELAWYYLLREATKRAGGILKTPDDETWIWSDLHLGDETAIEHGGRPFEDTETMTAALLEAWRTCVDPNHTIVNLGGRHARHDALAQEDRDPASTARTQDRRARQPRLHRKRRRTGLRRRRVVRDGDQPGKADSAADAPAATRGAERDGERARPQPPSG